MMTNDRAESIAVDALGWMAMREDLLEGFLSTTGASADELRGLAGDPGFLGFVLDHVLSQDEYVLDFAQAVQIDAADVATARACLPGGDVPNWT